MDKAYIKEKIMEMKSWLSEVRRDFHMNPELSEEEFRTHEKIKYYLKEMGIEYLTYEGQNAVVGLIKGDFPGKTVAIRADMDALPIEEKNSVDYKSKKEGVMHACGHDAHITILLGVAKVFSELKTNLHGNIKLLFQPAEETVGGADLMVKSGCMMNPTVDYVIGLHVMPHLECGLIESKHGALNSATDEIIINIKGKSAHGAYPDLGIDGILIAGHVITALQGITSRSVSPLDSVVLTIGKINGGTKNNIIADEVTMSGTLRTINPKTREMVKDKIRNLVEGICTSFGGEGKITINAGYEALINSNSVVDVIINTTEEIFGKEKFILREKPSLGAEDFSYFLNEASGAFYHLGCANHEKNINSPLHTACFDIDEECLPLGVMMHTFISLNLLSN